MSVLFDRISLVSNFEKGYIDDRKRRYDCLLKEGKSLSDIIAVREDVFDFLTLRGISKEAAYHITEQIRMGKGVNEIDEKLMLSNDVPEWYITSCKKIKYLFPRTQCISYALNLWKLSYCKIHFLNEFYEEYFKVYKYDELVAKEMNARM